MNCPCERLIMDKKIIAFFVLQINLYVIYRNELTRKIVKIKFKR